MIFAYQQNATWYTIRAANLGGLHQQCLPGPSFLLQVSTIKERAVFSAAFFRSR